MTDIAAEHLLDLRALPHWDFMSHEWHWEAACPVVHTVSAEISM